MGIRCASRPLPVAGLLAAPILERMLDVVLCAQTVTGAALHDAPLARALVDRGHRVTVLSGVAAEPRFAGIGAEFVAVPEGEMPDLAHRLTPFLQRAAGVRRRAEDLLLAPLEDQWSALDGVLRGRRVDVVVGDAFFLALSLLVQLPRDARPAVVVLGHFPLLFPDPLVAPFGLGIQPSVGLQNRLATGALRFAAANAYRWLTRDYRSTAQRLVGTAPVGDIRDVYAGAEAWAQLSVPRFEYPRAAQPANLRFVGPLSAGPEPALPDWWDPVVEPPVVVVQHAPTADLEDIVLPTVRAFGGSDEHTVLITRADREQVQSAAQDPLPSNVHFERTAPWSRLIAGRTAVISTGDYVDVQHALRHGLPVVVAGTFEPDVETAARVAWAGAGIDLRTRRPDVDVLRDAVLRVLGDAGMRRSAAGIAAQIEPTDAEATICDLVEELAAVR